METERRGFSGVRSMCRDCRTLTIIVLLILTFGLVELSSPFTAKVSSNTPTSERDAVGQDVRGDRFLKVPHLVWGLNNQKIAIARAALTARYLNRTLIAPILSSSMFINESDRMPFGDLFSLEAFSSRCKGFVGLVHQFNVVESEHVHWVEKGTGRRWTIERDKQQLDDLKRCEVDTKNVIVITGRNPFLWPDHWSVKDYSRVLNCLVLTKSLQSEVEVVVSNLRQAGLQLVASNAHGKLNAEVSNNWNENLRWSSGFEKNTEVKKYKSVSGAPYVVVHMRIERDWMLHCRHLEKRAREKEGQSFKICATKEEIIKGVSLIIPQSREPLLVYLAVADFLLEDENVLQGWGEKMVPFEKKKLGVLPLYKKHPYIIQSAIDFEVCKQADMFVGNSFSTFSSLVVLARTMELGNKGVLDTCGTMLPSYAYNVVDERGAPKPWVTNMSESTLTSLSYGTNDVHCQT